MLNQLNLKLIKPALITIAVVIVSVTFWPAGAKDSKQANVTEEKAQKAQQASAAKTNKKPVKKTSTTSKPVNKSKNQTTSTTKSSSTSSTKRRLVTTSRPGMKYRVVRYVDEPEITPERELRKSGSVKSDIKDDNIAKK